MSPICQHAHPAVIPSATPARHGTDAAHHPQCGSAARRPGVAPGSAPLDTIAQALGEWESPCCSRKTGAHFCSRARWWVGSGEEDEAGRQAGGQEDRRTETRSLGGNKENHNTGQRGWSDTGWNKYGLGKVIWTESAGYFAVFTMLFSVHCIYFYTCLCTVFIYSIFYRNCLFFTIAFIDWY